MVVPERGAGQDAGKQAGTCRPRHECSGVFRHAERGRPRGRKSENNIGLKFAFRSTDIVEIKKTLEFFGLDPEDEGNQKRLRNLENGQCLMQDLYGHVGVVQFHPVFADFLHGFDTKPPMKAGVAV